MAKRRLLDGGGGSDRRGDLVILKEEEMANSDFFVEFTHGVPGKRTEVKKMMRGASARDVAREIRQNYRFVKITAICKPENENETTLGRRWQRGMRGTSRI